MTVLHPQKGWTCRCEIFQMIEGIFFIYVTLPGPLRNSVAKTNGKLNSNCQGGVIYLSLTHCKMVNMSREIELAMFSFIGFFRKGEIAKYSCEIPVFIMSEELLGA